MLNRYQGGMSPLRKTRSLLSAVYGRWCLNIELVGEGVKTAIVRDGLGERLSHAPEGHVTFDKTHKSSS